jgi:hypothetical protein
MCELVREKTWRLQQSGVAVAKLRIETTPKGRTYAAPCARMQAIAPDRAIARRIEVVNDERNVHEGE